ncbi:hypothetical protein [Argonema antarcticum]|uniref:hypothetical protein n=1 Tax=Argonema antarcticum TaxID=2942763 RepID=UPI00201351C8|nr:hypothetical protein [Argonema antarcticum]MCL1473186.1 hypothetical protein [Argonema antarcticum A004/B2]
MFSIDIFLTHYGRSTALENSLKFAQKHKTQLLNVLRIDKFSRSSDNGQILGDHIFYLIFANSQSLGKLFVLGCEAKSGYGGASPADFKRMMDWLTAHEIDISYYSPHSDDEHLKFWGTELNEYGEEVPSANGLHRKHGPSPWDYGDLFFVQGKRSEVSQGLWRKTGGTKQKLYFSTLEFLLEELSLGEFLNYL